jgi:membrane protein DedA with SNARE-associated domain
MSLEHLVANYGYWGVLIGTFLEGDIALLLGGLFARLGYLKLSGVILAAILGAMLGDQFFYYLGRHKGLQLLNRFPKTKAKTERVFHHLRTHGTLIVLAYRFVYGFRIITPLMIGASGVKRGKFALLNATGAIAWALAIGCLGYVLGEAVVAILQDVKHYEGPVLIGVLTLVALAHLIVWYIRKRRKAKLEDAVDSAPPTE